MRYPWISCGVGLAAAVLFASLAAAAVMAQAPPQTPTPPPIQAPAPGPYTPVAITLPPAVNDPSFDAFRQRLAEIAQKKDRAALARLVAANFFWIPEETDLADKRKSGIDNLAKALGLDGPDAIGWEVLAAYAAESSATADPQRKGVYCAPTEPMFDEKAAEELAEATHTDAADWVFPLRDGIEVRETAKQDAPVIDKLGLYLVRALADDSPANAVYASFVKVMLPSGKVGFVPVETVLPIGGEQLCYVKDASGWKIAGFLGGEPNR